MKSDWHLGEPLKQGFYIVYIENYVHVEHCLGDGRGWTYKQNERPPKVKAWQELPAPPDEEFVGVKS